MSKKTGLLVSALVIVATLSGVGYYYSMNQLENAVSDLEIVFDSVELKGLRLLPSPEANLTLTYVANNTHSMEFTVTLDGELYYGSRFITPLTIEDARIRGNGLSTFQMDVTITGSILDTINPEKKSEYIIQGDLVAETRALGVIPVKITRPLSNYQPGQN